eukprot:GHVN01007816.1.p1 GENE.GHVN01007816.1~~GHVN01007816.1.p1  ORF type:complete len:363 (-),score=7.78 GHVN01007816.1:84-1172(-)
MKHVGRHIPLDVGPKKEIEALEYGIISTVEVELPPRSEVAIPMEIKNAPVGCTFFVEGVKGREECPMAPGVTTTTPGNLIFLNSSNSRRIIRAGTIIGKATTVPADVHMIDLPLPNDPPASIITKKIPEGLDISQAKKSLTTKDFKRLQALLTRHNKLFPSPGTHFEACEVVEHEIPTGMAKPISQPPRRVAPMEREIINEQEQEMLNQGIIERSRSAWASPVVLAPKPGGKWRFCIDYRKLNNITAKDVYPLPRIDDCLNAMEGMRYFSTFDLLSGYWQVKVADQDKDKTAFVSPNGLFQFRRMPFGLCNAPATFQRLMDFVLAGIKWQSCLVYLDDVVVFSRTADDHFRHLEELFQRLGG